MSRRLIPTARPRVEGDREQEIFEATIEILGDVGYDRLTMDAVATLAKASKATLYRRWQGKAALVIEAIVHMKGHHDGCDEQPPDTGSLRGDLLATFCGEGSLADPRQTAILGSLITAISRDAEFAEAFRSQFIAPKAAINQAIFQRALDRGEIRPDVDLEIVIPALPGILIHRLFLLGEQPTTDVITRVVDQVILPAVTHGHTAPPHTQGKQ
ncbi:MAG TPA: TetR/AcrR family transcriptional regulator [Nocardioides sp.]|nr:TetR/AcrR family transcriptional regulator [Nocardioides sp.]